MSARTRTRLAMAAHWAQYIVLPTVTAAAYVIFTRDKRAAAEARVGAEKGAAPAGEGLVAPAPPPGLGVAPAGSGSAGPAAVLTPAGRPQ